MPDLNQILIVMKVWKTMLIQNITIINGKLIVFILLLNIQNQIEQIRQKSEQRSGFFRSEIIESTPEARIGLL